MKLIDNLSKCFIILITLTISVHGKNLSELCKFNSSALSENQLELNSSICNNQQVDSSSYQDDLHSRLVNFIAFACVLLSLTTVAILCTVFDVRSRKHGKRSEVDRAFSLYANGTSLLNFERSTKDIKCLHGLRVISILGIILLHTYFFRLLSPFLNKQVMQEFMKTNTASIISALNILVDTFFVMSAALTTRSVIKDLDNGKFNYFRMIFLRYMRLTPTLIVVILLNKFLALNFTNNVPESFFSYSARNCDKHWLTSILHLQVYANPKEMCMHSTWYLSVEWQLTVISPLFIYLLWKFGTKAISIIMTLALVSSYGGVLIAYVNEFIVQDLDLAPDIYNDFYNLLYYPTHIRAQSYFIGMILGYLLTRYEKNGKCDVEGKICEAIMWLLASTLVTGLFGINIIYYIMQRNLIMNSFFMGNVRLEWAISVSSLILLCHTGKAKIINQILSSRYWMPLAKMGLSIYLIHPVLQYNIQSPREFITNFDFSHMISNYFCDVLLTVLVSLILYLLVEEPFTLLGKIISNKLFDIDSTKNFIVLIEMKINKFLRKH